MPINSNECPLCGEQVDSWRQLYPVPHANKDENLTYGNNPCLGRQIECPTCGEFILADKDVAWLQSDDGYRKYGESDHLVQTSHLVREWNIQRLPPPWIRLRTVEEYQVLEAPDTQRRAILPHSAVYLPEFVQRYPKTVAEKLDRILCNLARLTKIAGEAVLVDETVCFGRNTTEAFYFLKSLEKQHYVSLQPGIDMLASVTVEATGWERFDALTSGPGSRRNPVFVAMWYGRSEDATPDENKKNATMMDRFYREAIRPAVQAAGYEPTRVDETHHTQYIMDKVISDIKVAPCVIADFTGNRGGVYFEAGYARGLGKQVIHTCNKSWFGKAHFDIQQINTIDWDNLDDSIQLEGLRERIANRIKALIGEGPLLSDSQEDTR